MNSIVNLQTVKLQSDDGRPASAIVLGLSILEPDNADTFVWEVAEKFKTQRMSSPPETCMMLVTIIGEMRVAHFAERWQQLTGADSILKFFMSQMTKAEVVRGTVAGQALETASLVRVSPA